MSLPPARELDTAVSFANDPRHDDGPEALPGALLADCLERHSRLVDVSVFAPVDCAASQGRVLRSVEIRR